MDPTEILRKVTGGGDLSVDEAEAVFDRVMSGELSPERIAALLAAMRTKGHAPSEVAGGVRALRRAMIPIEADDVAGLVDTCGTGGGAVTTFNISTAAALLAAGAGVRIAKHGNRSFTSRSGSADVLEALGVRIELSPEEMARVLREAGIVFMFAPLLHPAMRHVAGVRRELGVPTIMNLLGPLTNPAGVRRQVVGVSEPELVPLVVKALRELGHLRALVVHGEPGMDEVSPLGPTRIAELRDGIVRERTLEPEALGPAPGPEGELAGGSPQENARIIEEVLYGMRHGMARAAVVLNAGAALHVAGRGDTLEESVRHAREALDGGKGREALERLRDSAGPPG